MMISVEVLGGTLQVHEVGSFSDSVKLHVALPASQVWGELRESHSIFRACIMWKISGCLLIFASVVAF